MSGLVNPISTLPQRTARPRGRLTMRQRLVSKVLRFPRSTDWTVFPLQPRQASLYDTYTGLSRYRAETYGDLWRPRLCVTR